MYTQHTNKCISDCALLSSPRKRIQQAKSLGSLTSHRQLTDDCAPAPGGDGQQWPPPCPGMKWDIKTHQLCRWLDSQQHNTSQCAVCCDLFNLGFIYFYVKHKHCYIDLFQHMLIYVLWVKIILMKVVSWGWIPIPISLQYVIQHTHWTQDLLNPLLMQMPSLC